MDIFYCAIRLRETNYSFARDLLFLRVQNKKSTVETMIV